MDLLLRSLLLFEAKKRLVKNLCVNTGQGSGGGFTACNTGAAVALRSDDPGAAEVGLELMKTDPIWGASRDEYIAKTRSLSDEQCAIFAPDGTMLFQKRGEAMHVSFSKSEMEFFRSLPEGSEFIHNHPGTGGAHSPEDILFGLTAGITNLTVVGFAGGGPTEFNMKMPRMPAGLVKQAFNGILYPVISEAAEATFQDLNWRVLFKGYPKEKALRDHWVRVWQQVLTNRHVREVFGFKFTASMLEALITEAKKKLVKNLCVNTGEGSGGGFTPCNSGGSASATVEMPDSVLMGKNDPLWEKTRDEFIAAIVDAPVEHVAIFGPDGKMLFAKTGNQNRVEFEESELDAFRAMPEGSEMVHNHPGMAGAHSPADVYLASYVGITSTTVVARSPKGNQYEFNVGLRRVGYAYAHLWNDEAQPLIQEISSRVHTQMQMMAAEAARSQIAAGVKNPQKIIDEMSFGFWGEVWRQVALDRNIQLLYGRFTFKSRMTHSRSRPATEGYTQAVLQRYLITEAKRREQEAREEVRH